MPRELHVAVAGLASVGSEVVTPAVDIAVYRSDGPAINDTLTPTIALKVGGIYLPPTAINAAIMNAVKTFLADPAGWNVPNAYDAEYLLSGVSVGAAIQAVKKTADSVFSSATPADVPIGVSGGAAMAFTLTAGRIYRFSFESIVRSNTTLVGIGMSVTTPTFSSFGATARFPGLAVDGVTCEWVGNITASDDPVVSAGVVATNTDYRFVIEGTIVPSASGPLTLRARTGVGIATVTVRQGTTGMLWDLGT